MKRAKHQWRLAGGEGLVRTLSAEEFEHFKETNELPRPGNVSTALLTLSAPFGRLYMRREPQWLLERYQRERLEQSLERHDNPPELKLAGAGLLNEWVTVGRYSVLNTARERAPDGLLDRLWLDWAVRFREFVGRQHLNRHSRGRRKENRQQTLANWLQNPDAKAQQFRDMVEMLNHDAKVIGHALRFGYWPRGPQELLIWELRDGAIMKAVFATGTDDLVTSVLGEMYDDGMFIPDVAKEMNEARDLERRALILHLERKPSGDLMDRAHHCRERAKEIRLQLKHMPRSRPRD